MPAAGRAKGCHGSCQRLLRQTLKPATGEARLYDGGSKALRRVEGACGTSERKQRKQCERTSEQPKGALGIFLFFEKHLPFCHQSLEMALYKGIARWWQIWFLWQIYEKTAIFARFLIKKSWKMPEKYPKLMMEKQKILLEKSKLMSEYSAITCPYSKLTTVKNK